jgi:flagellar hook-length control protein FliK
MTEHAHVQKLMEHHLPELHNVFQNSELNLTSVNIHNGDAQDKRESSAYQRPEEDDDLNPIDNHNKSIGINNNQRKKSIIDTYA